MRTEEIKIFIADDHRLVTDGLTDLLQKSGYHICGVAYTGADAVKGALELKPDIILMDVDMPEMNGLEAAEKILSSQANAKVIMLTMHMDKGIIIKAIQIGAIGYLVKNSDRDEFIKAIGEVVEGRQYFSPDVTRFLALGGESIFTKDIPEVAKTSSPLSDREEEVLKALAEGLSSKEIADLLHLSPHTIDTHRKNIMRKLGVANTAGLIKFAIRTGLVC